MELSMVKSTTLLLSILSAISFSVHAADAVSSASIPKPTTENKSIDAITSATIVPESLRVTAISTGFTDSKAKKVLFVVGDPRFESSLEGFLVNSAINFFKQKGYEVEVRDLYKLKFNPVLSPETFYHAKDGFGPTPQDIVPEQKFVSQADYIIFCYPNWHDSPNAITKGYMERVFSKQFAYKDTPKGLEGMLKGKGIYTIMNAGWLGDGQGTVGDGIGKLDKVWDKYLNAYKVVDDDTAGFWGATNIGRFVNDQSPKNTDPEYKKQLEILAKVLEARLNRDFFNNK